MKKVFEVSLSKSYKVQISANSQEETKRLSEFYTSDVTDISTENARKADDFCIESIECVMNEALDSVELK